MMLTDTCGKDIFSVIKPKFEYASHIWHICTKQNSDTLKNVPLGIVRIITGATEGTSHDLMYTETNCISFPLNCIKQFDKMPENQCPEYNEYYIYFDR